MEAAANAAIAEDGRPRPAAHRLIDAPRELIAYAVTCGDLRAMEPRQEQRGLRVFGIANACAPGWAPDGRLVLVGPLGRPPGSGSSLWLLARNGGTEMVDVADRSVTGRPAIWSDRTSRCAPSAAARRCGR